MSKSFEDLEVWKKACRLSVDIYKNMDGIHNFSLKDQICRAVVSIASNIAEGSERGGNKEFIRFLRIAQGSSAELRTQLYISKEIKLVSKELINDFIERSKSISQMLQALINSLNKISNDKRSTVNSKRTTT